MFFTAQIEAILKNKTVNKTKTVDVRFIIDNDDYNLVPSMFGKVNIETSKEEKLTLPKTAVLKKLILFMFLKLFQMMSLNLLK